MRAPNDFGFVIIPTRTVHSAEVLYPCDGRDSIAVLVGVHRAFAERAALGVYTVLFSLRQPLRLLSHPYSPYRVISQPTSRGYPATLLRHDTATPRHQRLPAAHICRATRCLGQRAHGKLFGPSAGDGTH